MEHVIAIVALVLTGPLVGVELGVAAFTNPLVAKLPDDAYRVFRSGGSRLLGALMPFWYIGSLVVLIAGAVLSRNVLTIAAVALMASHWPSASCDFGALTPAQRPSARRNRTVLADRRAARYS
jgi:hypothetical protein